MSNGLFITLEGVEGTGKSTFTSRLVKDLTSLEIPVVATREPGGSTIGKTVRSLLLDPDLPALNPRTEALLFAADRAQHVAELINPALDAGKIVLCDRYLDSSVAYQGKARGLGMDEIKNISLWGTQGRLPDLTILIDIDPAISLGRKSEEEVNRMEQQEMLFHQTVRAGLLEMAEAEADRFIVIDGTLSLDEVYNLIYQVVLSKWLELILSKDTKTEEEIASMTRIKNILFKQEE